MTDLCQLQNHLVLRRAIPKERWPTAVGLLEWFKMDTSEKVLLAAFVAVMVPVVTVLLIVLWLLVKAVF